MRYATVEDLEYRLSATYAVPQNALQLLDKASELIDTVTLGRAEVAFLGEDSGLAEAVTRAVCDQVEFWLEVGEEHDVTGLRKSLVAGRVQMHPVPPVVGPRTMRALMRSGLLWRGVGAL